MRLRGTGLLALPTAILLTACGSSTPEAYDADDDSSSYSTERGQSDFGQPYEDPRPFTAELDLPEGRKIAFYYADKTGLAEQHYSPEADAWTEPHILYKTDTDPCSGIDITESNGTVAVVANWNLFCYDGEPPDETIAAVSTGDLTEWDTDLTRHFDGWDEIEIIDAGAAVRFTYQSNSLDWSFGDGF